MTLPLTPPGGTPPPRQLVRLRADQIILGDNARKSLGDPERVKALFRSRSARQIMPLVARTSRVLLDGYRTLQGWELCGRPDVEFDVVLTDEDLTPEQIAEMQGLSAFHREDWNLADKFEWVIERLRTKPANVLAAELAVDPASISNWRTYEKLPPEGKQAVRDSKFGVRQIVVIAGAKPEHQAVLLAKATQGCTDAALIKLRKELEAGVDPAAPAGRPTAASVKVVVDGYLITVAREGELSVEDAIKQLPEAVKALERLKKEGHDAKTLAALAKKKLMSRKTTAAK